jgi:hypothetical protein
MRDIGCKIAKACMSPRWNESAEEKRVKVSLATRLQHSRGGQFVAHVTEPP